MIKKIICPVFILLLLNSISLHATTITTNTTWTSPQTITGDLEILPGVTLVISGYTQRVPSDIYIYPGAELLIENSAEVYMAWYTSGGSSPYPDGKIVVEASTSYPTGGLLVVHSSTISGDYWFDGTLPHAWTGIMVEGTSTPYQTQNAVAKFTDATIENSENAVGDYDWINDPNATTTGGGIIYAIGTTFQDSWVDVLMRNYIKRTSPSAPVSNDLSYFWKCNFKCTGTVPYCSTIIDYQPDNWYFGGNMIYLENVEGINILGCTFSCDNAEQVGINANNADFNLNHFCTAAPTYPIWGAPCSGGIETQSSFTNFFVAILSSNSFNFHRTTISNSVFTNCNTSALLSGLINPIITENTFNVPAGSLYQTIGVEMDGCSNYQVEGNLFKGSSVTSTTHAMGLVIYNSGHMYNDVYKNTFNNLNYGTQAIGENYSGHVLVTGGTGLTYLCNDISQHMINSSYDMSVELAYHETLKLTDGINYYQSNGPSNLAAGNLFSNKVFSSSATNNVDNHCQPIDYYYGSTAPEKPKYVSSNVTLTTATNSACPSRFTPGVITTFSTYAGAISNIVSHVYAFAAHGNPYSPSNPWLQQYVLCTDSMINTFLYGDTLIVKNDSLEYLLQNYTPYLYTYQLQLAGLYVSENRFSDAFNTLNNVRSNDTLDTTATTHLNALQSMYSIMYDLYNNGDSWTNLSTSQQDSVYNTDTTDNSYGHVVAEYLLHRYMHKMPVAQFIELVSDTTNDTIAHKQPLPNLATNSTANVEIYPNPVNEQLNVVLPQGAMAILVITDITGREIENVQVHEGLNQIYTSALHSGTYIINISDGNSIHISRKLIKQ